MNGLKILVILSNIHQIILSCIYRPQCEPEKINLSDLRVSEEEESDSDNENLYNMTPITPMPSKEILIFFHRSKRRWQQRR